MKIGFDAKRFFHNNTGLGNYSRFVVNGLYSLFPENDYHLFSPRAKPNKIQVSQNNSFFWRTHGIVHEDSFSQLDVYHGLSNELPLSKYSIKSVVTIHDVIFKQLPSSYSFFDRQLYDYKTSRAIEHADKVVAVSQYTKRQILNHYKCSEDKIEVIYQDCDPKFYDQQSVDPSIKEKYNLPDEFILCVGTIEQRKSQLLLLKAAKELPYPIVLVGRKGNLWAEIEAFLEDNPKLKNLVTVVSNAKFEDFPSIYRAAKLFVYPSIVEGFGIPVLEAMNCGTPVITTRDTVMEEVCGDSCVSFIRKNYLDLRDKITFLWEHSSQREQLITSGIERAKLFRKERVLTQLNDLYHKL